MCVIDVIQRQVIASNTKSYWTFTFASANGLFPNILCAQFNVLCVIFYIMLALLLTALYTTLNLKRIIRRASILQIRLALFVYLCIIVINF